MDVVEVLALGIPILALLIPIVAIMTQHQRRMAEIIHRNQGASPEVNTELASLRLEVQQLKELLHQQMIALDTNSVPPPASVAPTAPPQFVEEKSL